MNKGQTAIMLAVVGLLLILLLSGRGCGTPVWKAVPCTAGHAGGEFYIINNRGFEVEGRYMLNAYLEVDSSGASFTFRGLFGRESLNGSNFSIQICQGGMAWWLTGIRQGSCIAILGEENVALLLQCLRGEESVCIRIQSCGECFSFSIEPDNFAELFSAGASTRGNDYPPAKWPAGLVYTMRLSRF